MACWWWIVVDRVAAPLVLLLAQTVCKETACIAAGCMYHALS
jgi:hypothetical protein